MTISKTNIKVKMDKKILLSINCVIQSLGQWQSNKKDLIGLDTNRLPWEAPVKQAFAEAYLRPVKKLKGGQPLQWLHTIKKDFKTINISLDATIRCNGTKQNLYFGSEFREILNFRSTVSSYF